MIKTELKMEPAKPPMTDEEKKLDRARRQAELDARLAHAKREAKVQKEAAQSVANARAKEGCVTLNGMFISCRLPGKGAAQTAAEGQGGPAGAKKKDPPVAIDVMPFVRGLAAHQVPGLEYRVKSPTCIEIPARDVERIKACRDKWKKNATCAEALAELKVAQEIVGWAPIEEGKPVTFKTFMRDAAANIVPLRTVQLFSVEAVFQSFTRKSGETAEKIEFMCGTPVAVVSQFSPKIMLMMLMDLHQLPVQLPDATNPYPGAMVSYFHSYERTLDDEDEGRGCVVSKVFSNDSRTEDFIFTPQDKPSQLAMSYRMSQDQDGSNPAFPVKGMFGIQAQFFEGAAEEQKGGRALLRREFGINDTKTWSEIMAAQSIPAIIAGGINMKSSLAINSGRDHRKDTGLVPFYANAIYSELRLWLLQRCLKVSKAWVMRKLKIKGNPTDKTIDFNCANPKNQNLLNDANLRYDESDRSYTLINGMVINAGAFSGDINDLMARCPTPCEFRVLHSVPLDDATRVHLAQLDTVEAEKCLAGTDDAVVRLEQPTVVIYLVATLSAEEQQAEADAEGMWLKRLREDRERAAAAANNPRRLDEDAEPMDEGADAMEGVPEHPAIQQSQDPDDLFADNPMTAAANDNGEDDADLVAAEIQRQLEEEMAAVAQKGKRVVAVKDEEAEVPTQQQTGANRKRTGARPAKAARSDVGDGE